MPPWLKTLKAFVFSPPLNVFWILFVAFFVGCYLVALAAVHAIPSQSTVIHRCRFAWGLAFLMHGFATFGGFFYWYSGHRMLADLGKYLSFYIILFIIDMICGVGLLLSSRQFRSYRVDQ